KIERDAPALVVLGSSFHQRGTTNENSLNCRACTDGSAKRHSLDERSVLGVTFALTAPALVVLGNSFHQRGTTNENSLDCRACTDGSAKRRSLDERSVLGVTFALTRAFR